MATKKVVLGQFASSFWEPNQPNPENRILRVGEIKELQITEVVISAIRGGHIREVTPTILQELGLTDSPVETKEPEQEGVKVPEKDYADFLAFQEAKKAADEAQATMEAEAKAEAKEKAEADTNKKAPK